MENLLEIINSRRSVRNFSQQPIEKELIKKIIDAATKAPSACNVQGWYFVVIDSEEIKQKLIDSGGSIIIKNSPVGILMLYDNRTKNTEYQDHIQSAAAGIENLLLTATYYNLSSCWLCHLPTKKQTRKILSIPRYYDPIAYILLGYKQKESIEVPRKYKIEDLIGFNKFQANPNLRNQPESNLLLKRLLVKIYHIAPLFLKKKFFNKYLDKNFVKKFKN